MILWYSSVILDRCLGGLACIDGKMEVVDGFMPCFSGINLIAQDYFALDHGVDGVSASQDRGGGLSSTRTFGIYRKYSVSSALIELEGTG